VDSGERAMLNELKGLYSLSETQAEEIENKVKAKYPDIVEKDTTVAPAPAQQSGALDELYGILEENKKSLKKSLSENIGWIAISIIIFGFIAIMAIREVAGGNDEQIKLDNIELQIEEAMKDKNYDHALVLVEKLTWTYEINKIGYSELVIEYEKKRNGYRTTINQIIERKK
jgi:hypothetical protein